MDNNSKLDQLMMDLIVHGGAAKSGYIEAVQLAKEENHDGIAALLKEADKNFEEAHKIHFEILNLESDKKSSMQQLMLIHAEDQLNSAEIFKVLSEEMIELYKIVMSIKQ